MSEHLVTRKSYVSVFASLMLLTATTVTVARIDLGAFNTIVALVIAACKATLVILVFMHVRYGPRMIALTVFAGILWLALLIGLTLTDYLSRGWLPRPTGF